MYSHWSKRGQSFLIRSLLYGVFANSLLYGSEEYNNVIRPFLDTYCVSCHGHEKQKADRRFDTLVEDFSHDDSLLQWQEILDQLNLGEMPPSKKEQPSKALKAQVIEWLSRETRQAYAAKKSTGGTTVLRRLNNLEYDQTVRKLLNLEPLLWDPIENLPPDEEQDDLINVGSALTLSNVRLKAYLKTAKTLIEHASFKPAEKPQAKKLVFHAPFYKLQGTDAQDVKNDEYQHIRRGTADAGGFLTLEKFKRGVPYNGYYRIRFKAQAVNREYPYDESIVGVSKKEPLRIAIVAGSPKYGPMTDRTSSDRKLAEFELPDRSPEWFETVVWLDKGYQPRFTFPNGPTSGIYAKLRRPLIRKYPHMFKRYLNYLPSKKSESKSNKKKSKNAPSQFTYKAHLLFFQDYKGPRVRLYEVQIEGPFYKSWPSKSHAALFNGLSPTLENAKPILKRFASFAFRRPVEEDELSTLMDLVRIRHQKGDSPLQAIKTAQAAVLCSPGFLYLREESGQLSDYTLAVRLSYFLWSTMPDNTLFRLGTSKELRRPQTLKKQVIRMLDDPRSKSLSEHFLTRWLELYKIGSMPPGLAEHKIYYTRNLEEAMLNETKYFFQYMLRENLPLNRFIDSDFTFINGDLADLYGIKNIHGKRFRKVKLTDRRRGGLMGQASILTASANGIDTSPVIRGIWVLKNLLGHTPSPPPPDVEPLEPDIRGAQSIRDQLKKHRTVTTCNECHRKIDPLGFALESFDPIGAYRDRYKRGRSKNGPPVDTSGQMPDGQKFKDITSLKEILLSRKKELARCLTEKMLAYAMGRSLELSDRPHIDRIVENVDPDTDGLRDLILEIVQSKPFLTK